MKALALETIVKLMILLVLALVVSNLIIYFSNSLKKFIGSHFEKKEFETETIESKEFTTQQLMTYIRTCWHRTGEKFDKDVICFILKGDVSKVKKDDLIYAVEFPAVVDVSNFDPIQKVTIIRFQHLGKVIVIES